MVKKIISGILVTVLASPLWGQKLPVKRIALIVTIDNYLIYDKDHPQSQLNWQPTHASTDLQELWKLFRIKQQFEPVDTLTESNATRKGILKALDNLKNTADTGSIVVFYFSGHGQQIYDVEDPANGLYLDEADGYDEALVPYDAKKRYGLGGYKGENHIRDDELGSKLDSIRKKIGPTGSLLVMIDACHSGTITRDATGRGEFRGTTGKIEPPGYDTIRIQNIKKLNIQNTDQKDFLNDHNNSKNLSPMVVISASAQDELNYPVPFEGDKTIGALTFAFMKAVENYRDAVSYNGFFKWIKGTIEKGRDGQTPLIEGPDSLMVLGNKIIPTKEIIVITPDKHHLDSVQIDRGMLHDIFPGMGFSVYPQNIFTYDTSTIIAKGTIVTVDPFNSKGVLNKKLDNNDILYKAIFNSKAFGDLSCAIDIRGVSPTLLKIRSKAGDYKNLVLTESNSDLTIKETDKNNGQKKLFAIRTRITDNNYDTIWQKLFKVESEMDSVQIADLFLHIKRFTRAKYMRSFSLPPNDNTFKDVSVEIIPVKAKNKDASCGNPNRGGKRLLNSIIEKELSLDSILKKNKSVEIKAIKGGESVYQEYAGLQIKIVNKSDNAVFLSVLEIQPDNIINVRVPYAYCDVQKGYIPANPNEFKIAKGDSAAFSTKVLDFSEPLGLEYLKIIISDKSLNLTGLSGTTKDPGTPKGLDDFLNEIINDDVSHGKYFKKKGDGDQPGSTVPVRTGSMKVVNYIFKIVE